MSSIGQYQFVAWDGRLVPADLGVALIEPLPGVDGFAAGIGAWRAPPVIIKTICYAQSIQDAENQRESMRSLEGTSVQVLDQFGVIWSDVLVMSSQTIYDYTAFNTVRLVTTWRLLVPSYQPGG